MLHGLFLGIFLAGVQGAANKSWRSVLLDEAKLRTNTWYPNKSLVEEKGHYKDGVSVHFLNKDLVCGGSDQPVCFFEFDVSARPVDVFNMLVVDPKRPNPCADAVSVSAGEFKSSGLRAWSVVTRIPVLGHMEFVQWEVVDADVEKEEFWLLASTMKNDKLIEKHPLVKGAIDADVCLASYHIFKNADGTAHIIGTRHMNLHFFSFLPMHVIMDTVPAAWDLIIKCVEGLRDQSQEQMAQKWPKSKLKVPEWMFTSSDDAALGFGDFLAKGVAFSHDEQKNSFSTTHAIICVSVAAAALLAICCLVFFCRRGVCVEKATNGHSDSENDAAEPFWSSCVPEEATSDAEFSES